MANPAKCPLPFMKTMEDAFAICQRENDPFYPTAFMIEAWLGKVTLRTVAEYAEHKRAKNRKLQQGLAAECFTAVFGHVPDAEFPHLFNSLLRFAEYDDCQSRILLLAYGRMALEYPPDTWLVPVLPIDQRQMSDRIAFMRGMVRRLCEWVEAATHAQTHKFSHLAPVAFDPDPESRELAILGIGQRHFPGKNDFQKAWWEWHHGEAAERLSEPAKWSVVGKSMMDDSSTHQNYPALDEAIILFWPLVLRHQWTYRDLMNVLQSVAPTPLSYPCVREQDLATYCVNVLGLRKRGRKGKTTKDGLPEGYLIAHAICGKPGVS